MVEVKYTYLVVGEVACCADMGATLTVLVVSPVLATNIAESEARYKALEAWISYLDL